jgi:uncharacterized glyoxalase superfamily protein PhnB
MSNTQTPETAFEAAAIRPSLTVKDLSRSAAWYQDVIGFAIERRVERDGQLHAVAIRAGAVRVLLNQDDGRRGWDRVKGEGFSLTFQSNQDVDAVAARITAHGGAIDTEPADMPWGERIFRVRDPDGYRLVISQPVK